MCIVFAQVEAAMANHPDEIASVEIDESVEGTTDDVYAALGRACAVYHTDAEVVP